MPRPVRWKDLTFGLVALAAVIAVGAGILLFAKVGVVRGAKETVYVAASSAAGVIKGTEVLIAGKRAGSVDEVRFLPPTSKPDRKLVIEVSVLRSALPIVRRDSRASIHPSGTIIGAPVVELSAGSAGAAAIRPGDTIVAPPQLGPETVAERTAALGAELGRVRGNVREIMGDVRAVRGTFGALRVEGPRDLAAFRSSTGALMRRVSTGGGTIALTLREGGIQQRLGRVLAEVDTMSALLSSPRGNIGRFRRDRTLVTELERARGELDSVMTALADARGTAGRWQNDRALMIEVRRVSTQLSALIADMKRNPFRYITF